MNYRLDYRQPVAPSGENIFVTSFTKECYPFECADPAEAEEIANQFLLEGSVVEGSTIYHREKIDLFPVSAPETLPGSRPRPKLQLICSDGLRRDLIFT